MSKLTPPNTLFKKWNAFTSHKYFWPLFLIAGLAFCTTVSVFEFLDLYLQLILIYVGINIILTASLNLINGYMGEFSVGHAGFMAVGAYIASLLTVHVFPPNLVSLLFPLAILAGGLGAAIVGFLVAIPSFKTRGDYLAIVTLAFCMIVKSVLEKHRCRRRAARSAGDGKAHYLAVGLFLDGAFRLGDPQPGLFQFRTRGFVHPGR